MRRTILAALASVVAATAAEPPATNREQIPIRFTAPDLSKVETAQLWVTDTGGATWDLAQSLPVPAGAERGPTFSYAPEEDGRYGFETRAVYRDGSADPAPMTGEPPDPRYVVVFDRRAPVIEQFEVTPGDADPLLVTVRWRAGDANPGTRPVRLEMAPREGGEWIPFGPSQPATGSWTVAFPTATHQLRLSARDRAGNQSHSEPWLPPAPARDELAAAAEALPAAEDEPPAGTAPPAATEDPADPALEEAISDLPDPAVLEEEVPAEPQATFVDSPPNGRAPAPEAEAAVPPAEPMTLEELVPLPALPAEAGSGRDPSAVLAGIGRVVVGRQADEALAAARRALAAGDTPTARALYRRLGDSPLAAEALYEEALLLAHTARAAMAAALADTAPAEARSQDLHALHARLLLRAGDFAAAQRAVGAISARGPRAREALWLGALATRGLEGVEAAAPVLRHLASGDDHWARLARELLRRG